MRELVSYMKECNLAIKNGCRELNLIMVLNVMLKKKRI